MLVLAAKQAVAALEKRAAKDGADALQSRLATSVGLPARACAARSTSHRADGTTRSRLAPLWLIARSAAALGMPFGSAMPTPTMSTAAKPCRVQGCSW